MAYPTLLHGSKRDLVQEHERRKLDDGTSLLLGEMDQDGDGQGYGADEEEGGEEGHDQRTRLSFSREDR